MQLPLSVAATHEAAAQVSPTCVHAPLVHEYEQLPAPKPLAHAPEVLPLAVVLTLQLPLSVAATHEAAAQVSLTCVHSPLVHAKEQLPAPKPLAQAPEAPPLVVAPTLQLPFSVAATQGAVAHVSTTFVHTPLLHEYEQLPAPKPLAHDPAVPPLFVAPTVQLPFSVAAAQLPVGGVPSASPLKEKLVVVTCVNIHVSVLAVHVVSPVFGTLP